MSMKAARARRTGRMKLNSSRTYSDITRANHKNRFHGIPLPKPAGGKPLDKVDYVTTLDVSRGWITGALGSLYISMAVFWRYYVSIPYGR